LATYIDSTVLHGFGRMELIPIAVEISEQQRRGSAISQQAMAFSSAMAMVPSSLRFSPPV
jgi:hypothetical protein